MPNRGDMNTAAPHFDSLTLPTTGTGVRGRVTTTTTITTRTIVQVRPVVFA